MAGVKGKSGRRPKSQLKPTPVHCSASEPAPATSAQAAETDGTAKRFCGKKGRSGPAKGNLNALRTGTSLKRLTIGQLPSVMLRQLQTVRKYRRQLESLVITSQGDLTPTAVHLIDTAVGAETHSAVCRWLLRNRLEKMSVSDVVKCSEQILKSKVARDKAVSQLGLDAPPKAPWETEGVINV